VDLLDVATAVASHKWHWLSYCYGYISLFQWSIK
jgi:hypothetical protein